jgi:hypothetical protein
MSFYPRRYPVHSMSFIWEAPNADHDYYLLRNQSSNNQCRLGMVFALEIPHPKLTPLKITILSPTETSIPFTILYFHHLTHVTPHPVSVNNSEPLPLQPSWRYLMVSLDVNRTSEALAVAGGYVVVIGLVSYFVKEKLFMCECIASRWSDCHADVIQQRLYSRPWLVSSLVPSLSASSIQLPGRLIPNTSPFR